MFYDRPNSTAPKLSRFTISPTDDPRGLVVMLTDWEELLAVGMARGGGWWGGARLLVAQNSHSGWEQDPSLLPASTWMFEPLFQVRQFLTFNPSIDCAKPVPHALQSLEAPVGLPMESRMRRSPCVLVPSLRWSEGARSAQAGSTSPASSTFLQGRPRAPSTCVSR